MKWKRPVAALTISATGLMAIFAHEGFSPVAYRPVPGDKWTIGYGSTAGVHEGDTITVDEAIARAKHDLKHFQGYMSKCVRVELTQGEFDAYLSFIYNAGPTNFCSSTMVRKLNAGDSVGACTELKKWVCGPDPSGKYSALYPNHHCGKGKAPIPGLVKRREEEFNRCMRDLK